MLSMLTAGCRDSARPAEGLNLEYVASISNLLNRPHFRFPRDNISAAAPGRITANRNFNQDQNKAGARMMDMTLRLRW